MTQNETTRLAVVETNIKNIADTTIRIEKALADHVEWEVDKYKEMDNRFAPLDVKREFIQFDRDFRALDHEVAEMPAKMRKLFAGIWVETGLKSIVVMVVGSLIIAGIYKLFA